ncbi:MAG TPA: DoxX family protein [Blastocatellia bacterium]|jgi:putative oxidoreductase
MERFLGKYAPYLYALLRIIAGLLFAMHGAQKLFGWPVPGPPQLNTMMLAAAIIELVCGLLIAIGLLTNYAAFIASGEMAVAFFIAHVGPKGLLPIANGGEPAVLYCFLFLYMAAQGSGPLSVDAALRRGRPATV